MEINITTPALLFPAISLLLLAFTNRFIALSAIVRQLSDKLHQENHSGRLRQITNLHSRLRLIKSMQVFGVSSILACVVSMVFLFLAMEIHGRFAFGVALVLMSVSLVLSLWEILLSGIALRLEIDDLHLRRK